MQAFPRMVRFLSFCGATALLPAQKPDSQELPPPANYTAHEWGTFTSMVGTNGIVLDGLHHEEEALPKFVHDLLKTQAFGATRTKLPASRVTQKMETPVIYFYADEPLRVQVRVWFQQGLMTQFFPLPKTVYPELADARKQRLDMSKVDGSELTWDIDVLPKGSSAPTEIPKVADDDPWAYARQTEACWVRTRPEAGSPARPEAEHYLFYRGLGRWQPKVTLHSEPNGKAIFGNAMEQVVPYCLALELGEHGGRFVAGAAVAPGGQETLNLASSPWIADREQFSRQVGANVLQALVKQGLFVDEARAMVATWSRSWFQKDGARIVYLLPRAQVDAVLPLHFEPCPKDVVRVLVGRLEFITPEAQQRVEQALRSQQSLDPEVAQRAVHVFAGLDRFLEPHLRNVAANGSSDAIRRAAATMLATSPQ